MPEKVQLPEACRVITPEFRVSYPHLFKPQAAPGSDKLMYSISMLFPKDTPLKELQTALTLAKTARWGTKDKWPKGLQVPYADGDGEDFKDKDEYAGHWVFKASSSEDQKPEVVDEFLKDIIDPAKLYAGCYARAQLMAWPYDVAGKKGVKFILNSIQKMNDGKPFGNRKAAKDVFTPVNKGTSSDFDDDGDDLDFR